MTVKRTRVGTDTVGKTVQQIETSQALKTAQGAVSNAGFSRAIVAEVITDPEILAQYFSQEDEENPLKGRIKSENLVQGLPRGALLVKKIGEKGSSELDAAIPMLSSHLMVPAKPGEQVWIFDDGGEYVYWLGRVGASGPVEDVNFTHKDRELETPNTPALDAKSKAEAQKGTKGKIIPRFNDGIAGSLGGTKNSPIGLDAKTLKSDVALSQHISDSVPRYTPRVGDLALQGSNNTLISLGTDRGWKKSDEDFSSSNADSDGLSGTGTIDIVSGRGAATSATKPTSISADGDNPTRTGSRTIENELGGVETDKVSKLNNQDSNRAEGDPDFHMDSSRVYVSMKSPIDENFSLGDETIDLLEGSAEDKEAASIAMKSNEIRIIAREDGSIRIVKEKGESDTGAQIIMNSDGTIHIQGKKILIGEKGGSGQGPSGTEPYVKYSELESYLNNIHSALESFCGTLNAHAIPFFGQSPQITLAASTLKTELSLYKKGITKFPSSKIYGE